MKKKYIFLIVIFIIIGLSIYFYKTKTSSNSNNMPYNGTRISANNILHENSTSNNFSSSDANISESNNIIQEDNSYLPENSENSQSSQVEVQIAEFTTKIYTKDSERQNNISITCSTLDNTIINNGDTFSFCNTVGKATSSKGYEKADVYQDGEVVQALGGGNCQVSSTLYNAVLKVDRLDVTERHSHSNSVPYVEEGKDAAVAYGSYDFKFVNNTGNNIKISSSCDDNFVYIKIFKIS